MSQNVEHKNAFRLFRRKIWFFLLRKRGNLNDSNTLILISGIIIGIASGFAALILKTGVYYFHNLFLEDFQFKHHMLLLLILPAIGIVLTVMFRKYLLRDSVKHNISSILHAISTRNSMIKSHKMLSSISGAILTAGFGGSIGLESPIISSGSAIGSNIGRFLRLSYKSITLLLACGAAGGISAIFNTPVAGIVFAIEVLMIDMTRFSLIPLLSASLSGTLVTELLFKKEILFDISLTETFGGIDIPFILLLGGFTAFLSLYFTRIFIFTEKKFEKSTSTYGKVITGSLILGVLIYVFPPLYGEGYETVKMILSGNHTDIFMRSSLFESFTGPVFIVLFLLMLVLFKVIATAVTLGSGGIGGIFAPSVFSGAILGFLFSFIVNEMFPEINLSFLNYTLLGMAGMLSGVLHAPLTAIFLIAELTGGYELIVPLMIVSTISFVIVKQFEPNSIFTMQLAQKGELITHHKDKAVLKFMKLHSVLETDLKTVSVNATLGDLVKVISTSKRNIFPVLDEKGMLFGLIFIENIREIMFNQELYEKVYVENLMISPLAEISVDDGMETVINKFNKSGAWNLPVTDKGKYVGFVSKSKLFEEYRKLLVDISHE